MISDHDARRLLQAAADTVTVGPAGPLETPDRRRWPVLVAAAAAVLAVVLTTTILAVHAGRPDAVDGPQPTPRGAVTVPSVLGYDQDEATELLTGLGLRVSTRRDTSCSVPPGLAAGTSPTPGSSVPDAGAVQLTVSDGTPPTSLCVINGYDAYDLLRFARGLGPAPAFAETVTVHARGATTTLTREQAQDPDRWPCGADDCTSPLAAFVADADRPWPATTEDGPYLSPTMAVATVEDLHDFGVAGCPVPMPRALQGERLTTYFVRVEHDGPTPCPRVALTVYRTREAIDAVFLQESTTRPGAEAALTVTVPSVLGLDADRAETRLRDAGLRVRVSDSGCYGPPEVAMSTLPATGSTVPTGREVVLDTGSTSCPQPPDRQAAWDLLRFAVGEADAPAFADSVVSIDPAGRARTLSRAQAGDLDSWRCARPDCESAVGFLSTEAVRAWPALRGAGFEAPQLISYPVDRAVVDSGRAPCTAAVPAQMGDAPVSVLSLALYSADPSCATRQVMVHRTAGEIDVVALLDSPRYRDDPGLPTAPDPDAGGAPSALARAAADAFVAFARGEVDTLDAVTPLPLYLGRRYAGLVTDVDDRDSFLSCPVFGKGYAGASCALSALTWLDDAGRSSTGLPGRPLTFTRGPTPLQCSSVVAAARPDFGDDTVTISGGESCGGGLFAITLALDDAGRITAVDLELGEP